MVASNIKIRLDDRKKPHNIILFSHCLKKHPDWDIRGERNLEPPTYWMWVAQKFHESIQNWIHALPTIPDAWKDITKEEAISSLYKLY